VQAGKSRAFCRPESERCPEKRRRRIFQMDNRNRFAGAGYLPTVTPLTVLPWP
jgi:hypothetical protein